jgi:hypothetical protein
MAILRLVVPIYLRYSAICSQHRLAIAAIWNLSFLSELESEISTFGWQTERLLMCGGYLFGELIGFTLESCWRASFLELQDRDLRQMREEADAAAYRRRAEAEEARLSAAKEAAIEAREQMASEKEVAIAEKELARLEKDATTVERHRLEIENTRLEVTRTKDEEAMDFMAHQLKNRFVTCIDLVNFARQAVGTVTPDVAECFDDLTGQLERGLRICMDAAVAKQLMHDTYELRPRSVDLRQELQTFCGRRLALHVEEGVPRLLELDVRPPTSASLRLYTSDPKRATPFDRSIRCCICSRTSPPTLASTVEAP